jgi:hypothetical protein
MAETINIAKMAEKLSKELFAEFLWNRMEPANLNWPCEDIERHNTHTHPSDVVFYYDEPYSQARTYVNCDLKSYAKGSITVGSIRSAMGAFKQTTPKSHRIFFNTTADVALNQIRASQF